MLFIILIKALLMLLLEGTDGQEIVFDPLNVTSPCSKGLRSGTDKFTLTGTVGRNCSALVNSGWSISVIVEISVKPTQFTNLCEIFIGFDGFLCDPASTLSCYCDHINSTTGFAHVVVSLTTLQDYSEGIIRAQWEHKNHSKVYSVNTRNLPTIYDVDKADLTLNDISIKQTSAPLGFHFVSNKNNTLQICCSNSASPCYPKMIFNGQVFESLTGNCVNLTVFVPNVNYTANVTSSYSVCTKNDYITAGSGLITTVEETPTVEPKDYIVLIICLGVIIPIVVVAIIIIAIVCYCKKRPKPSQSNIIAIVCCCNNRPRPSKTGTDEAATQDQTGRELNQESKKELKQETRQESEQNNQVTGGYTNNGFDERRTSPSSIALESRQDNFQYYNTAEEKNGSSKHLTGKTKDRGAGKEVPGKPRELPAVRGTHGGGQPPGKSRPPSVEVTSYAVKYNK